MEDSKENLPGYNYILALEHSKYYVGYTERKPGERIEEHLTGNGSKWTSLHKPLKENPIKHFKGSKAIEDSLTIEMMQMFGWINVRGGKWCKVEMETIPLELVKNVIDNNTLNKINKVVRTVRKNCSNYAEEIVENKTEETTSTIMSSLDPILDKLEKASYELALLKSASLEDVSSTEIRSQEIHEESISMKSSPGDTSDILDKFSSFSFDESPEGFTIEISSDIFTCAWCDIKEIHKHTEQDMLEIKRTIINTNLKPKNRLKKLKVSIECENIKPFTLELVKAELQEKWNIELCFDINEIVLFIYQIIHSGNSRSYVCDSESSKKYRRLSSENTWVTDNKGSFIGDLLLEIQKVSLERTEGRVKEMNSVLFTDKKILVNVLNLLNKKPGIVV